MTWCHYLCLACFEEWHMQAVGPSTACPRCPSLYYKWVNYNG